VESDDRLVQEVQSAELTAQLRAVAWCIAAAPRPFNFWRACIQRTRGVV
jgi:hypothetical protein